jgi:hypothetical protein
VHGADLCPIPLVARLGARPPDEPRRHLAGFRGERRIEQRICETPHRVATAWLAQHVMLGGERSGGRPVHWQHHPATLHWRRPDGSVGWLRLRTPAPVDAVAAAGRLDAVVHTGLRWLREAEVAVDVEVEGGGGAPLALADGATWRLPGLALRVATDARGAAPVAASGPGAPARGGWRFAPGAAPAQVAVAFALEASA